jgi:predicted nucleic acid-binding protein
VVAKIAFDTNILVYAVDTQLAGNRALALQMLLAATRAHVCIPMQVLSEFLNVNRRKGNLSHAAAADQVMRWHRVFETPATQIAHLMAASALAQRYQLSFFDALICAVSMAFGAELLLTEDMHDGLVLDGLTLLNPFKPENHPRIEFLLK